MQPSETKPGVLKARLQYLDAIIASGATDREVEIKIEPPEESQPAVKEEGKEEADQAMEVDEPKVAPPVKEETMDLEVKPQPERAASPLAPYVPSLQRLTIQDLHQLRSETWLTRYVVSQCMKTRTLRDIWLITS